MGLPDDVDEDALIELLIVSVHQNVYAVSVVEMGLHVRYNVDLRAEFVKVCRRWESDVTNCGHGGGRLIIEKYRRYHRSRRYWCGDGRGRCHHHVARFSDRSHIRE